MKRMKKILIVTLFGGISYALFFSSSPNVLTDGTNTNALYSLTQQQKKLKKNYPILFRYLQSSKQNQAIIPGLMQTKTLLFNQKVSTSYAMDPQGVKAVGPYLIISAYSRDFKHNSVLYVLNKQTGSFIKTIVLKGRPHVGGITYDPLHQNIWLTTVNTHFKKHLKTAQISAISLQTLKQYNFSKTHRPISYRYVTSLGKLPEASFLSYHQQHLYVGLFEPNYDGILVQYELNHKGKLVLDYKKKVSVLSGKALAKPKKIYLLPDKIQGIAFYKQKVIFSQSYGNHHSKLLIFDHFNPNKTISFTHSFKKEIIAPPYMEQITEYNDQLHLIFESATKIYRKRKDIFHIDRVLTLDASRLFSS